MKHLSLLAIANGLRQGRRDVDYASILQRGGELLQILWKNCGQGR